MAGIMKTASRRVPVRLLRALVPLLLLLALPLAAVARGENELETKAAAGSTEAIVALASRLELGIGVVPDPARAMALFCRAALLGDRPAILHIADWLLVDDTPDYDPHLAARWLHRLQRAERRAPLGNRPRCPSSTSTGLAPVVVAVRRVIERTAPHFGLDPDLVKAVVEVESSYRNDAISAAGAVGLMQLMPESAGRFHVTDRMDAEQNLRGGMRDLASLIQRYHGDLALALAAYNAGRGAVDACRCVPAIPETVAYVGRVLALYRNAQDREARALVDGSMSLKERLRLIASRGE